MPALTPRRARVAVASAALIAMSVAGVGQLSSAALFSDTASTSPSALVAGTVTLGLSGTASTSLPTTAMAPGQSQYGALTLTNTGNLQQRLSLVSTDSGADGFGATLTLDVVEIVSAAATCNATTSFARPLYSGIAGATAGTAVIGDRAQGQHAGDRVVDAAGSVTYCLRVTLPLATTNASQGKAASLTFTGYAEQTASNP